MLKKKIMILLVTLVALPVLGGALILWLGGDANKAGVTSKDMSILTTPAEEEMKSLSEHKPVDSCPSLDHTDAGQLSDVIDIRTFLHEKDLRAKLIQTHRANKKEFTVTPAPIVISGFGALVGMTRRTVRLDRVLVRPISGHVEDEVSQLRGKVKRLRFFRGAGNCGAGLGGFTGR